MAYSVNCISAQMRASGANSYGQLGQGDTNNRGDEPGEMRHNLSMVELGSDFEVDHVSCGYEHTCVLSTNYEIKCFGLNDRGQLGCGHTDNIGDDENEMGDGLSVVDLGTGFVPIQLDCGRHHCCALCQNSTVKCWGANYWGQLGQGDTDNRGDNSDELGVNLTPVDLGTGFNVSTIRCGGYHVCALSIDHDTKCWGNNNRDRLGLGDTDHRGDTDGEMGDALPLVDFGTAFVTHLIGGGLSHTLALSNNGSLKAWGRNNYGQLGYEDVNDRGDDEDEMGDDLPLVDVGEGFTVTDISSSCCGWHSCALLENGTDFFGLKCWGRNDYGQLGLGDTENRGDDSNEMGDDLPFISPTFPAADPASHSTMHPTLEPTTKCEGSLNCTECVSLNTASFPQCAWHFVDEHCYYYIHLEPDEFERVYSDYSHCASTDDPTEGLTNINMDDNWTILYLLDAILVALLCITIVIIWKMRKRHLDFRREMATELITISKLQRDDILGTRQGVIACIAVGEYEGSEYSDLPAIRDVENLREFSKFMGYDFIERPNKLYWTKEDITSFLMDDIGNNLFRQNGRPKYDVIIVCFSGHGLRDRVVTSDCQTMDRSAIHRVISMQFPEIRDVPRIFVFDACAGPRHCTTKEPEVQHVVAVSSEDASDKLSVFGKDTDEDDIKDAEAWTSITKNPDYKIVVINSANNGFQAHMRSDKVGSLLLYLFTKKLRRNVENHEQKGLAEIMDEIQKELHDGKKQQIECIFNNGTRNLVLDLKRERFKNVT